MDEHVLLWRRLNAPGYETARLSYAGSEWNLAGCAIFGDRGRPYRLDYRIVCDSGWRTVRGQVSGWAGGEDVSIVITVDPHRRWMLNGDEVLPVSGCTDLDLNFSPSTNLLPIRRLNLDIGQEATLTAAWLQFPNFTLQPLQQTYRRIDRITYRFVSGGGSFTSDLQVNPTGFVTVYPGAWIVEVLKP
jgi:hypothetical protein